MRIVLWMFTSCLFVGLVWVESAESVVSPEASLDVSRCADESITFDLHEVGHRFDGFGTQIFTFNNNLKMDLLGKLEQLNIRYVRLTRRGTWEQMRSLRELTNRLNIEWVYYHQKQIQ